MTDTYKRFVKVFQAAAISDGLGYGEVAEIMNVHPNTIRNWWAFRSIMDGEAVLKAIRYMGGYKC